MLRPALPIVACFAVLGCEPAYDADRLHPEPMPMDLMALPPPSTSSTSSNFRTLRFGFAEDRLPDLSKPNQDALYAEIIATHLAPHGLSSLYFTRVFVPDLDPDPQTWVLEDDNIVAHINRLADLDTVVNIGLADLPYLQNVSPAGLVLPAFYTDNSISIPMLELRDRDSFPPLFTVSTAAQPFGAAEFEDYVSELYDHLSPRAKQRVLFETGNEPEALQFFWGTANDYLGKADAIRAGLRRTATPSGAVRRPYRGPIFFGGFTSATMADLPVLDPPAVDNQHDFFQTAFSYNNTSDPAYPLGFHMFRHLGYGVSGAVGGVQEKGFDDIAAKALSTGLSLNGASISSYSLFGKVGRLGSDWKVDLLNSDFYVYDLAQQVLPFTYDQGVEDLYFWKLFHRDVDDDHRGAFTIDTSAATMAQAVVPNARFHSVSLVWELISDGYQVQASGDYTEITGLDPTGQVVKKLLVTADKQQSPIVIQPSWQVIRQSQLQGTEPWVADMQAWYGYYQGQGCADCAVPNTEFDWVRYDVAVPPSQSPCSVEILEPVMGLRVQPGGTVDLEWDLVGYPAGKVYLSVFSGWSPAVVYLAAVIDNDGHEPWDAPADPDPQENHFVYLESAEWGVRDQRCWDFAPLQVLPFVSP